uniref:Uncharacterized protein n=1 Tax=Auxenochlorella protothecoides TaxID=3075 RepID=A0A1D1ZNW2_AUXPR
MITLLGSPLVLSAATTVVKKAFEASVATSLKGLGQTINQLYKGDTELLDLKTELETKVRMLALPIDIFARHVTQSNTALQEAVGVAIKVLHDIDAFQDLLTQQEVQQARRSVALHAAAPRDDRLSSVAVRQQLRKLIQSLDGVLPYLTLAISAVGLLSSAGVPAVSPSRYAQASHSLLSQQLPGEVVYSLDQVAWYRQSSLRPQAGVPPQMSEVFPLCTLSLVRGQAPFSFQLSIQQGLDDGRFHDEEESAESIALQVSDLSWVEWGSSQSLSHGSGQFKPALILHFDAPSSGTDRQGAARAATCYAIQIRDQLDEGYEDAASTSGGSPSPSASSSSSEESAVKGAEDPAGLPGSTGDQAQEWGTLGCLEYVIKLCALESREQACHTTLQDERIQLGFQTGTCQAPAPGARPSAQSPWHPAVAPVPVSAAQTPPQDLGAAQLASELGRRLAFTPSPVLQPPRRRSAARSRSSLSKARQA